MIVLKKILKISVRNLFRNRRRTFITLSILILSGTGLILVGGFFNSLLFLLKEAYIRGGTGHLQVNMRKYYDEGRTAPFEYLLPEYSKLKNVLKKNPNVNEISPQINFGGMLTTEDTSVPVIALGIDPETTQRLDRPNLEGKGFVTIVKGKDLDSKEPHGILIGEDLQKALGLDVGDTIYFITTQKLGAIEGAEFYIRGVYQAAIKEMGERIIKMPISMAQKIWDIPDQVHSINVHLNNTEDTYAVKNQLEANSQLQAWNTEIIPWDQQGVIYTQTEVFLKSIYRILQTIIGIIIFFSIANTINMNLLERIREYGTMMAFGCDRGLVASVIVLEAGSLGILGGVLGIGVAGLFSFFISKMHIYMPPPPLVSGNVSILVAIKLSPQLILETFSICFFATVLSSLIPAYRATHLRIVQALGYT